MDNTMVLIGYLLLFLLPVIESYNKFIGLQFLLTASLLISFDSFVLKRYILDRFEYIFLAFITIAALSTNYSISVLNSYSELMRYLSYFLILVSLRRIPKRIFVEKFYTFFIVGNFLILLCLFSLYSSSLLSKISFPFLNINLFYPTFGHNHIDTLLIFSIPLSLFFFTKKTNKYKILFYLEFFFVQVIALFFGAGRGAILSIATAISLFSIYSRTKNKIILFSGFIICVSAIILLLSSFVYSNFNYTYQNVFDPVRLLYKPMVNEARFDNLNQAFKGFATSPLVGTGLNTFEYISIRFKTQINTTAPFAHNHFVELFLETGVWGGFVFALFIVITLYVSSKQIVYDHSFNSFVWLGLFGSIIHSLLDFDWHHYSIFLLFFVGLSIVLPAPRILVKNYVMPVFWVASFFMIIILVIFRLDSDVLVMRATNAMIKRDFKEAETIFLVLDRIDAANAEISDKLENIYSSQNMKNEAGFWKEKGEIKRGLRN